MLWYNTIELFFLWASMRSSNPCALVAYTDIQKENKGILPLTDVVEKNQ